VPISVEAARRFLHDMGMKWRQANKAPYMDGHERLDVVAYRAQFVNKYLGLQPYFTRWGQDGEPVPTILSQGQREIVVVTHDESTFHSNDGRKFMWLKPGGDPLRKKGIGKGIMVSDFLTPGGRLACGTSDSKRYATHLHELGPNNYWTGDKMTNHTLQIMVPIFEERFPSDRYQGLFLFDNATNHCHMADDALVVKRMNLRKDGKKPVMRDGWNPLTHAPHQMWLLEGNRKIPKGIELVLRERGLWPVNDRSFKLDCKKGTHSEDQTCCARRLLGSQPDFVAQKCILAEALEARGHLVMFYPKFHPELNFIEYYWGQAKRFAREHCQYNLPGLRSTLPEAFESVSPATIHKFHERTLRAMLAYKDGYKLGTKEFQERVYRSHRRV